MAGRFKNSFENRCKINLNIHLANLVDTTSSFKGIRSLNGVKLENGILENKILKNGK